MASIATTEPAPLSVAPVPPCQESRWAPSMTTSSFLSVPGISAIVFHCIWSSSMNRACDVDLELDVDACGRAGARCGRSAPTPSRAPGSAADRLRLLPLAAALHVEGPEVAAAESIDRERLLLGEELVDRAAQLARASMYSARS